MAEVEQADVFVGVAAVADYRPEQIASEKIKKHDDAMQMKLVRNPDIISAVAELEKRPLVVGFAAETENLIGNAEHKLSKKRLDLLFANDAASTFNSDSIAVTAVSKTGNEAIEPGSKSAVARAMLAMIAEQLKA
jgi:phosphopantothenoylcysteine decarboxylase/phosphopantothenate--cysteine ligase